MSVERRRGAVAARLLPALVLLARPADALAGRRRAPVQKGAKAHSKKRKRKESGQGMAPPDTPVVEGASP